MADFMQYAKACSSLIEGVVNCDNAVSKREKCTWRAARDGLFRFVRELAYNVEAQTIELEIGNELLQK